MKKLYLPEVKQKANQFLAAKSIHKLEQLLDIKPNLIQLMSINPQYNHFEIPKKGGFRKIEAPHYELMELQRMFNYYLQTVYYLLQTKAAYAFIISVKKEKINKNILTNTENHLGHKYMLNIDLKDFFHQVKIERVRKLFRYRPFEFDKRTVGVLAKLFTNNGRLPMGAPTSPVLTNLVSIKLDHDLTKWAEELGIVYTRFADDMTFSTDRAVFNREHLDSIIRICYKHQFELNTKKTKFFDHTNQKTITGLALNETVDIENEFYDELNQDLKRLKRLMEAAVIVNRDRQSITVKKFKQEVQGKVNFIGMIEGFDSDLFYRWNEKYKEAVNPTEERLFIRWTHFNYF